MARPPLLYLVAFVIVVVPRSFWRMPIFGRAVALWLALAFVALGISLATWGF